MRFIFDANITKQLLKGGLCFLLLFSMSAVAEPPFSLDHSLGSDNDVPSWRSMTVTDQEEQLLDYQQKKHGRVYVPNDGNARTLVIRLNWPKVSSRTGRVVVLQDNSCKEISIKAELRNKIELCWRSHQLQIDAAVRHDGQWIHLHRRFLSHPYWQSGQQYHNIGSAGFSGLSLLVRYASAH